MVASQELAPPRPAPADAFVRRLLRIDTAPPASPSAAESIFGTSIAISAVRCLLTYVALPLLRPIVDLTTGVGPLVGIVISIISIVAIVISMRRFWAAWHRMRWAYTIVGGGILVLLVVQAGVDVAVLAT